MYTQEPISRSKRSLLPWGGDLLNALLVLKYARVDVSEDEDPSETVVNQISDESETFLQDINCAYHIF